MYYVIASDADGSNVQYSFIAGNRDGLFSIDNEGVVKFTKSLTRSFSQLYGLTIQAFDGVCKRTTVLNINVTACRHPFEYQFKQTQYTFDLREDRAIGVVGQVMTGSVRNVEYSINTTAPFSINSEGNFYVLTNFPTHKFL